MVFVTNFVSGEETAGGRNIASLAAYQARRAAGRPGATPELLADVTAAAEILTEVGASGPPPGGGDTAARLARLSDHHERLARLAGIMTRIEVGSPESSGYWRVIGSGHRDIAAQMRHAALLAADAESS